MRGSGLRMRAGIGEKGVQDAGIAAFEMRMRDRGLRMRGSRAPNAVIGPRAPAPPGASPLWLQYRRNRLGKRLHHCTEKRFYFSVIPFLFIGLQLYPCAKCGTWESCKSNFDACYQAGVRI